MIVISFSIIEFMGRFSKSLYISIKGLHNLIIITNVL